MKNRKGNFGTINGKHVPLNEKRLRNQMAGVNSDRNLPDFPQKEKQLTTAKLDS